VLRKSKYYAQLFWIWFTFLLLIPLNCLVRDYTDYAFSILLGQIGAIGYWYAVSDCSLGTRLTAWVAFFGMLSCTYFWPHYFAIVAFEEKEWDMGWPALFTSDGRVVLISFLPSFVIASLSRICLVFFGDFEVRSERSQRITIKDLFVVTFVVSISIGLVYVFQPYPNWILELVGWWFTFSFEPSAALETFLTVIGTAGIVIVVASAGKIAIYKSILIGIVSSACYGLKFRHMLSIGLVTYLSNLFTTILIEFLIIALFVAIYSRLRMRTEHPQFPTVSKS